MAIRPRITDPYSQDYKDISRRLKHGAPPKAPKKPTFEERKPLVDALKAVPLGQTMSRSIWTNKWVLPYMKTQFTVWGVDLALYPVHKILSNNQAKCTGVMVCQLQPNAKTGMTAKIMLRSDNYPDNNMWYGHILHWIEETNYK